MKATPRTDAALYQDQIQLTQCQTTMESRKLERELAEEKERIKRLEEALKSANSQAERFERWWRMRGDRIEQLEQIAEELVEESDIYDRRRIWRQAKEAKP